MTEIGTSSRKGKKLGLYNNANLNLKEHNIILKHNKQVETNLLNMVTNISQENEEATVTTPTNISVVPRLNTMVIQQREIHTQT